jgi:hypothetical protein
MRLLFGILTRPIDCGVSLTRFFIVIPANAYRDVGARTTQEPKSRRESRMSRYATINSI